MGANIDTVEGNNVKAVVKARDPAAAFATWRDRMRVKSHLLGMESREAWDELNRGLDRVQERLNRFVERAGDRSEELRLQATLGLMEAEDFLTELKGDIDGVVDRMKVTSSKAHAAVDRGRLTSHLARLEAKDYLDEKSAQWRAELKASGDALERQSERTMSRIQDYIARWSERLPR